MRVGDQSVGGLPVRVVHPLPVVGDIVETRSLGQVVRWWRRTRAGVCALVGIGGCGKTTATDEFLRLTSVLAPRTGLQNARVEPTPSSAFLYSLTAGSLDSLFEELREWTSGSSKPSAEVLTELGRVARAAAEPLLIVIDGLEHFQSSGGAEGVGRLTDPRLRDLITRCAYGALPGVAMIVTTRLALTDVEVQRLPLYSKIEMDALDSDAAVVLLRARGVAGSERQLRHIGDSYGRHALTIDLAARFAEQHGRLPDASGAGDGVLRSYLDLVRDTDDKLLGLLSLFRRGVSPSILRTVARRLEMPLADDTEPALRRLSDIRVLSRAPRRTVDEDVLSMHEVVRTLVEDDLEPVLRRRWHTAIAAVLIEEVEQRLHELDATARYDLLEMCLAHGVVGENPISAAELYWIRIGNFGLVGHRDSRFAWGEAVCRSLNEDMPPGRVADYLRRGTRGIASVVHSDWALYLAYLGELASSLIAHRTAFDEAINDTQRTIGASNIASVSLQRGELPQARLWADESQRRAFAILRANEGMPTAEAMRGLDEGYEWAARAELNTAGVDAADAHLEALAYLHREAAEAIRSWNATMIVPISEAPIFEVDAFQWGVPRCEILLVRGESSHAAEVAQHNLERWLRPGRTEEITSFGIRAVLVAALLASPDTDVVVDHLRVMESWALAYDARSSLSEVHLLAARLARLDGELPHAADTVAEGLRTARETGSGLLHVELLIESARISLELGEPDDAAYAAATALFGQEPLSDGVALYAAPARDERLAPRGEAWYRDSGIFPTEQTGRPVLLAATHPDCAYRWGEGRARELLAEALLASLARASGRVETGGDLTRSAERVVAYAEKQLERAAELADEITGRPLVGDMIRDRLIELRRGTLTRYLACISPRVGDITRGRPATRRVLISYTRSDSAFVDALADGLSRVVDDVWVDRRKISIGESFVAAINAALLGITDFIVVLSRDSARSAWVANELNAAIALRNGGAPITIRPVVLDGVSVPPLLADLDIASATNRDAASVIDRITRSLSDERGS